MGDIKPPGRRRPTVRGVLLTGGALLAISGVAAAMTVGRPQPAPRAVVVHVAPVVRRAGPTAKSVKPSVEPPTSRAAVYVPRPVNLTPPTITGIAKQTATLVEAHGGWTGDPTGYSYQWSRCDAAGNACSPIANATAQSYPLASTDVGFTVRVEETASNASGAGSAATSAATAVVAADKPPPPALARTGTVAVLSGRILIRLKGSNRFIELGASQTIPTGSEIDATGGRVGITVATGKNHQTATAEVYEGLFVFTQGSNATTRFTLSLPLTGCGRAGAGRSSRARVRSAATPRPKARKLWVSEHGGHWSTHGKYVSTTVEGTRWLTVDECSRSRVLVASGRVRVRNLLTGETQVVHGGRRFVASRPAHHG